MTEQNRPESTASRIRRLLDRANDINERRRAGDPVTDAELVDLQRAKVALLSELFERHQTDESREALAAARAQLAEQEAALSPAAQPTTEDDGRRGGGGPPHRPQPPKTRQFAPALEPGG